jgi:hypothetical protein
LLLFDGLFVCSGLFVCLGLFDLFIMVSWICWGLVLIQYGAVQHGAVQYSTAADSTVQQRGSGPHLSAYPGPAAGTASEVKLM